MESVLKAIELLVAIALIVVVLLQRSEGGALGMGGGGSGLGNLFSARGAANTLTRTTAILGALLFIITMALTIMAERSGSATQSILNSIPAGSAAPATSVPAPLPSENQAPASSAPATPAAPANPLLPSVPASR